MWFTANIIFKSVKEGTPDPLIFSEISQEELNQETYEERIILVKAQDEETAFKLAEEIGKSKEVSYKNKYGQNVYWEFLKVDEVKEINEEELEHGTELFYRFYFRNKNDSRSIELE